VFYGVLPTASAGRITIDGEQVQYPALPVCYSVEPAEGSCAFAAPCATATPSAFDCEDLGPGVMPRHEPGDGSFCYMGCAWTDLYHAGSGGAVYVGNSAEHTSRFDGCVWENCTARDRGGGCHWPSARRIEIIQSCFVACGRSVQRTGAVELSALGRIWIWGGEFHKECRWRT
jgi:hypothetical protein